MISSQRDTLLVMADALEDEYLSFARDVRRAADTIWELQNKLAGTVDQGERITELEDENARLRSCLSDDAENARQIMGENAKLRELVRGLHMAYVGAINKCESLDEALIWEFSGNIDDDVAKSKAEYESDRHRFDVAMRELGVTDD